MKKILIAVLLLTTIKANTQSYLSPYMNIQTGYVSDKRMHFDYAAGLSLKADNQKVYPIAEVGGKFQLSEDKVAQAGDLAAGIEYSNGKIFSSVTGGVGYVFNLPINDRYITVTGDTIYFAKGNDKPSYFSPYCSFKAGIYVNGENTIPVFLDLSYVGKLVWYGVGIKITF